MFRAPLFVLLMLFVLGGQSLWAGPREHKGLQRKPQRVQMRQRFVQQIVVTSAQTQVKVDTIPTLQAVTVKGIKQDNNNTIRTELKAREIEQTRGQSLGEVLQRAVGVSVLQTGSTIFKPVIHGLHSQRILMLNNGVRQEGQQWGSEHAPEIDPFVADKFTVLKGAGALRYGPDAIAGAVLVEPRALRTSPGTQAEINLGYFSNNRQWVANAQFEQGLKKIPGLSWRLQATYKRGGNARTPDEWLYNTGIKEFNYSGALAWRGKKFKSDLFFSAFNTDLGIFMGSHIGNLTDLINAINSPVPLQNIDQFTYAIARPRQAVQHYLLKSKSVWEIHDRSRFNLVLSHQENRRQEYDRALVSDRPELDLTIGTTALDAVMETDHAKAGQTQYGLTGMFQQNVWSGSRFYIPNFEAYNVAGFALHKWAKDRWLWEGGVRYDFRHLVTYRNQNNLRTSATRQFNNVSATLGATYLLGGGWKAMFNGALAWRAPQVNELYVNGLHHGAAIFEIGDSSLLAERAHNFSGQLQYESDSTWEFDLTLYSNWINGFINLVPSLPPTLTLRGAYPTFRYVQTNAWLGGIDLQVRRHLGQGWQAGLKSALL
ncbi:MAG: TonB-dependent receptor, partial [Sphingobacteriia bacterium]